MPSPQVSIIIPAYNEATRLPGTLRKVFDYLETFPWEAEVLVVDDGSTDGTPDQVEGPARVVRNAENHGKGYAVRQGMLEARGEYRVFMDADLSVPPPYLEPLVKKLEEGYDVVIGSRTLEGAVVDASARPYRRVMGHVFNSFVQLFAIRGIRDTQCGFKAFRKDCIEALFGQQKLDGFAFDVELLYLARKQGLRIAEIPVEWVDSEESRINPISDSFKMFCDLVRIRWLHRK